MCRQGGRDLRLGVAAGVAGGRQRLEAAVAATLAADRRQVHRSAGPGRRPRSSVDRRRHAAAVGAHQPRQSVDDRRRKPGHSRHSVARHQSTRRPRRRRMHRFPWRDTIRYEML